MTSGAPERGLVVVGAINADLVVVATRLPGPGETVVGGGVERFGGGKGANAAVAAARAGAAVSLVGAVGADDTGVSTLADLRGEGVDVDAVSVLDGEATGVALIVVDPHGENQVAVGAGANAAVTGEQVSRGLAALLPSAGCVLISTEIADEAVAAALEAATAAGVPCVLNPAPPPTNVRALLQHGPVTTPNATEAVALATMLDGRAVQVEGGEKHLAAVQQAAQTIQAQTGAPVVVTLGGDGVLVVHVGGDVEHILAPEVAVHDTTGAGDTFNGVLASRLTIGDELTNATRAAVAAAALSVTRPGARGGMPDHRAIEVAAGSM